MSVDDVLKVAIRRILQTLGAEGVGEISTSRVTARQLVQRELSTVGSGWGLGCRPSNRAMRHFRDLHRGQRAFILGNGPSLNDCDLSVLADEITFGVNAIYLNREHMGFDPTYYVVEDIFVAEDRAEEIRNYRGPTKFIGRALRYTLAGSCDTVWCNVRYRYRPYAGFPHFSTDCERQLWVGGTVAYLCMQLAFYMGFSEVYLIGFDHNYAAEADDNVVDGLDIVSRTDDQNHFHPGYFGKGYRWHDPKLERMRMAFERARAVFDANGRTIRNATIGGHLEIFDRVEYGALF